METGAVGQVTDFKESTKKIEWGLKKVNYFPEVLMFFYLHLLYKGTDIAIHFRLLVDLSIHCVPN